MTRFTVLCDEIIEAIMKAKEGNEELFKKAQELEAKGELAEAYALYRDITDVGFLDYVMETGDEITEKAFDRRAELSTTVHNNALQAMDSKPFSELTYDKYSLNGACCQKLRDAFEHEGISVVEEDGKAMLCVDNYYKEYDEIDENMDVRPYNEGVFFTEECPFCGKKLKKSE